VSSYDVVICGAGIAGVAAADALTARGASVLLVDERPPLSLTSDKSSECYRNWWPGPDNAMVALMNRSIDHIEALARETQNAIALNRRGYLYITTDPAQTAQLQQAGETAAHARSS
jgi:glycine/D-amino acid oxidase-like deaminating enzyme